MGKHLIRALACAVAAATIIPAGAHAAPQRGTVAVSLELTPTNPRIAPGAGMQLHATASFDDGTVRDVTSTAHWSVDGSALVLSNGTGKRGWVTGRAPGQGDAVASFGGVIGRTRITVTSATLVFISIVPGDPSVGVGDSLTLTAYGTFSDGSSTDITHEVTWRSSDTRIARLRGATVVGRRPGAVVVTAVENNVQASVALTVTGS